MSIRRNDNVMVIAGRSRGKRGKVHRVMPKENRLIVEGVNLVKRHTKPRGIARQAGIIEKEAPIHVSNVMLVCPKCSRPVRTGAHFLDDGKKVRVCRGCGEIID